MAVYAIGWDILPNHLHSETIVIMVSEAKYRPGCCTFAQFFWSEVMHYKAKGWNTSPVLASVISCKLWCQLHQDQTPGPNCKVRAVLHFCDEVDIPIFLAIWGWEGVALEFEGEREILSEGGIEICFFHSICCRFYQQWACVQDSDGSQCWPKGSDKIQGDFFNWSYPKNHKFFR